MVAQVSYAYAVASGQHVYAGRTRPLPAWMANEPLWKWFDIPGTNLSSVDPIPFPYGKNPSNKTSSWNGVALRRQGSVLFVGAAGGHGDYPGNEVDALPLNVDDPAWSQLRGPSAEADMIKGTPVYLDGRRAAVHNYWSTQFDNINDRMLIVSSGGMHGDPSPWAAAPEGWPYPSGSPVLMGFDLSLNDWTSPTELAALPHSTQSADLCCSNGLTGEVFMVGSQTGWMYKYNPSLNTWTNVGAYYMNGGYRGSAIDHTRNRMLIVGDFGGTSDPIVRSTLNASAISVSFGGLGASALRMSGYPGVIYDEHNDCFMVAKNSSPITLYRVDAETFEVTIPTTTGVTPAQRPNAMLNAVQYVPELRGLALVNSHSGNVKFMRTSL